MKQAFLQAARSDPQHHVLMRNVEAARTWFRQLGPERGLPLELDGRHDFQLFERTRQPTLPGPLPDDFAVWGGATAASPPPRPAGSVARRLPLA
jgi:hypothetical protein